MTTSDRILIQTLRSALGLILAIEEHPETATGETVSLRPMTRRQIRYAMQLAEESLAGGVEPPS